MKHQLHKLYKTHHSRLKSGLFKSDLAPKLQTIWMATTSTHIQVDHSWMEGNAGWERCTNPSRPLCNSSQGWTVNRWSLCVPMFVHQTVNQALYTVNAHRQWFLGQHCSPKVPSVEGLTYIELWSPYRHQRPYWHTPTVQTYSLSLK